MKVHELSLVNFRNYATGNWKFSGDINVFYGANGQGKTNILEAIYFSSLGYSHRTFQESDLVRQDTGDMSVAVRFSNYCAQKQIVIKRQSGKTRKEIILDNNKIKPRELVGELKTTIFSPEDLQLVKGDPSLRRRFLDMEIAQTSAAFCLSLAKYNKILQQRNRLLQEIRENRADGGSLEVWDRQFAKEAACIALKRIKAVEKITLLARRIYEGIAGGAESVGCLYKRRENGGDSFIAGRESSLAELEDFYREGILARRQKDIERAATGIGPHRDDLLFTIKERPLKAFGSQGQQRSFVLALKLAELQFIKDEAGEYPILLLDDVMSELDPARRRNLLDFLNGRVQTFITLTDKGLLNNFKSAGCYLVNGGTVTEESNLWK